jgi:hypothetical protein
MRSGLPHSNRRNYLGTGSARLSIDKPGKQNNAVDLLDILTVRSKKKD